MNFIFQGFDTDDPQWKFEEAKDQKYTMTLSSTLTIPIPNFLETFRTLNKEKDFNVNMERNVIPTVYGSDYSSYACFIPTGEWSIFGNIPWRTQMDKIQKRLERFVKDTLEDYRLKAIEKRVTKMETMFEQIAERSDVFAVFVKEGEAIVKEKNVK